VFSLGVMAYEMLSGERPMGSDAADADEARLAAELPTESRAAVRRVLATAMSESPADRYESAQEFVSALQTAALAPAQDAAPAVETVAVIEPMAAVVAPEAVVSEVEPPVVSEVEPARPLRLTADRPAFADRPLEF
jgi:hypothetical protein